MAPTYGNKLKSKNSYIGKCAYPAVAHTISSLTIIAGTVLLVLGVTYQNSTDSIEKDKSQALLISGIILTVLGFLGWISSNLVLVVKKCYKVFFVALIANIFGIPI